MKKYLPIVCFVWIVLVAASFIWNYSNARMEQQTIAFQTARGFFNQVLISRAWNAEHGGVYVPVTRDTLPNPYLDDPLRDIEINGNLTLTKVNPAFMTRQIADIAAKREGIHFHITSLNPIRADNKPAPDEEIALKSFENGKPEFGQIITAESGSTFFYMAPLKTEKTCLACHARQGYKEGDIRGGISVTLPFVSRIPLVALMLGHIGICMVGLIGIIVSGTKLNKAYESIKRQAVIDALTGIPNRRSFSGHILTEVNRSQREKYPLSVIMGDIDNFKLFNDTYGHGGGDDCLRKVAQVINETLKRPSDFCARYGGEEFIIVLPYTSQEGALFIAEDIRTNVSNLQIPHDKSLPSGFVTISLGVATTNVNVPVSHEELTQQADSALYIAKEKGRNRVEVFNELI
ncbi:MAG: diguanylate cyclase [Pseudomonadota bacterium]